MPANTIQPAMMSNRSSTLEYMAHCSICTGKVKLIHHGRVTHLCHLTKEDPLYGSASIKILGHYAKLCRVENCKQGELCNGKRVVSV